MTTDELNGILPAVKYRVPTTHVHTIGNTAVFVLPAPFAGYMKLAAVDPCSNLQDAAMGELGKATDLQVIQEITTIYVELAPGCSVPAGHLQTSFKISRGTTSSAYYMLQSIYPEVKQLR